MKIDKHIYFPKEQICRVEEYCKKNNLSYTKAVCQLIDVALLNIDLTESNNKILKKLMSLEKLQNINFSLLKQIYSDLDFENITNPKTSKQVNNFLKKIRNDRYSD